MNEELKRPGIYKLTNKINEKIYIGKANNLFKRRQSHQKSERLNIPDNGMLITRAIKKYRWNNFEFTVLEFIDDITQLIDRESYWIKTLDTTNKNIGYNICSYGTSRIGFKTSEETKQKISKSLTGLMIGEKNPMFGKKGSLHPHFGQITPKNVKEKIAKTLKGKMIGKNNPFFGKKHSIETTNKMKQKWIERKNDPHWQSPLLGFCPSEETKQKMSEAKNGMYLGVDNPFFGKHHSLEVRKIISEKAKKRDFTYRKKPVKQLDILTNNVIKIWDSAQNATLTLYGKKNSHISKVCKKQKKSAFGFKWEYV